MATPKGIPAVLEKLEESIKAGDYYHAQQMYKTLYFRYSSKKQYMLVKSMLVKGACLMLEHSQLNNGVELGLLLLNHFKDTNAEVNQKNLSLLLTIFSRFPKTSDGTIKSFVVKCVDWSSLPENNNQGNELLHNSFAQFYWNVKDYSQAEKHFLRGSIPQEYSKMLVEWSKANTDQEQDTFIADAVFQYLCLTNLKDAIIVYNEYTNATQVLKRDAYPLLKELQTRYALTLRRDPDYLKYLQLIAKEFYGIEPTQGLGGLLGNILKSFM